MDKYRFRPAEAEELASFLLSMLCWLPKDRASAQKMLDHPWLSMPDDYDTKMSDLEFKKYKLR
jgi:serine/threonine protein kinase